MPTSTFFRLLTSPIPAKGNDLCQQIAMLNQGQLPKGVFQSSTLEFAAIPGSPFAYWTSEKLLNLFRENSIFETSDRLARTGLNTTDDFRFIRSFWEVPEQLIANSKAQTLESKRWVLFSKGGGLSPYHYDLHLVLDWANSGKEFKDFIRSKGDSPSRNVRSESLYFLPGLTWPLRASKFAPYVLPEGCIFGVRGQVIIAPIGDLLMLLAIVNSIFFDTLFKLSLGRFGFPEFVIGTLKNLPWVEPSVQEKADLAQLALSCFENRRVGVTYDETTHVFGLPILLHSPGKTLAERLEVITQVEAERQKVFDNLQSQINTRVARLYGVPELAVNSEQLSVSSEFSESGEEATVQDEDDEGESALQVMNPQSLVSDLLLWCVGISMGRWDVRFALNPSKLSPLPCPFDPLPVCSPGMLVGIDGEPLISSPDGYPLPVAWDGFLVDDPGHPRDIVSAVRGVYNLLWHDQAEAIEAEACQILGTPDLRSWFRDPRGFFAYHIKRYSKSRRKAPIYWMLQSAKRNYAIWLYYPRLNPGSLYHAGREYADAKLKLETGRLADWQRSLVRTSGSARKLQERKIAGQETLVDELKAFVKALDAAALLEVRPDLNDGVLLNVAPLHELAPWKEASRVWGELLDGKYEWSSIGKQLRQKGLVKNTNKVKEAK